MFQGMVAEQEACDEGGGGRDGRGGCGGRGECRRHPKDYYNSPLRLKMALRQLYWSEPHRGIAVMTRWKRWLLLLVLT